MSFALPRFAPQRSASTRRPTASLTPRRISILILALALLPWLAPAAGAQAPADLFISEYIEGGGNNKAIEIYNGTGAAIDLGAGNYQLLFYFNGSSSAGNTIDLTGTVNDGDVFVLSENNASAAILALADQTDNGSFYNGDDAVELRANGTTLDVIGQIGDDPGSAWSNGGVSTQNDTLRRKADICDGDTDGSNAFDPSVEWDGFPQDNIDNLGAHTANCTAAAPVINEFVANHTSSDTSEFVEIFGDANTDYSAFTILEIEGDSAAGTIDGVYTVGTTDASGYWTTGFLDNEFENGSLTILLVEGFTGSAGDDLDTDNDGLLDVAPWSELVDSVSVDDGGGSDGAYGTPVLDAAFDGGSFTVGGASRIPNGTDTDDASDWVRNDFDGDGLPCCGGATADPGEALNTPAAENEVATAMASDPVINEFVLSHAGTDTSEFIEIFGDASTDYSALTILQIEGDGSLGEIDAEYSVGTTDANGYWTTGFLDSEWENGTLTILLVEDFNPAMEGGLDLDTNDDGTLDITPWSRIVDAVGISDGGGSDATYGVPELTAGFDGGSFTVGGASRIPNGTDTDAAGDWTRNDFDGDGLPCCTATADPGEAINTPGAENQVAAAAAADPLINEFVANHDGSDTSEFVEVFGDASTDYSAFTILEIEGDSAAGTVDGIYTVGTTDANGYWTTGFLSNGLENGSLTILLVEGFTGSAGDDLDTDNDGTLDTTPWTRIVDAVAVDDGGGSDASYGVPELTGGFDGGSFTVGGASRIPNGTDTDAAGDWTRNDFDGDGLPCCLATADPGEALNTPGAENQVATGMAGDPVINEFVLSHSGTDSSEFIEIFGDPSTDYSALTILEIEGDGSLGEIDGDYAVGTTDANGYWTTGFLNSEWENGTLTILLVEDFNPAMEGGLDLDTNDDGTLDITPWSRIVDAVGISDGGGSDATYGVPELTAGFDGGSFTVGGASRIPNGTDTDTAADWTRNDFDGDGLPCCVATADPGEAINTPLAVNQVAVAVANDPLINEFVANHDGTDSSEFIEVAGDPSTDYSAFSVIAIEGDSTSPTGTIDRVYSVGTTSADGYWTTGFVNNQLENGTTSFLLVEGFTGSAGDDVDTNDDGAFDTTPWTRIVDDVAVTDGGGSDLTYATVVLTSGFDGGSFTVGGASRIPDATDTDATGDWTRNDFDGDGLPCCVGATAEGGEAINTPDATNRVAIDSDLIINEVDADTPSSDTEEFIELFDGGTGNTSLNGLVVVLYNGNGDVSYNVFDLTGQSTDANGYFVLGNAAVSPDLVIPNDGIQNGADAVALYAGTPGDFPNGTAVTLINLIDALVYGTGDADDAGLLVLLNAGQAQVDEAGGTGSATESNQRCPNGAGGALNTDTYTQATPTVGSVNNCVLPSSEIWEIQGSGDASPVANTIVNTEDNIVTAVGPEGFFMQTPTARSDGDPATSDGIYVFTGAVATGVAVGDQVDVVGEVVEFFDFTEFTNNNQPVTVTVDSSGNPLPPAIVFDAATPSPDPNTPSCPTNNFECFEGMLVTVANGAVSGPNQSFGSDPNAEIYAVADATRAFRETGIEFPGIAGLPVWDGNPEVFEVDPDKLGLPDDRIPAGSTYSATGGLGFEFGGYEIWPSSFSFTPATLPLAVALRDSGEFTIASLNFFRLFDDVDDPGNQDNGQTPPTAEYQGRLDKFSAYIRDLLDSPDVLAVQEVEKLGVLQDLAARIQSDDASVIYTAHLIEGNDVGGIDVGYLTRDTISVTAVTQLGAGEILTFDGSLLHDRPPLLLEADFVGNGAPFSFAVLNNHTRSLSGIDDAGSGPRVRQKRLEQAQSIAQKAQDFQTANPDTPLTVVGDLNAFQFTDGYVDVVGQIAGDFVAADNLLSGPDLVDPNLTIQVNNLAPEEQYSFIFGGSAQVLDHALTSQSMDPWIRGYQYPRGNADAALILLDDYTTPLRSSDHDGLVLFLMSDFDADGVPDDTDNCPFDANADQADNDMDGTGDACDGDSDGDTIPDGTEDQAPNGGDGNGDGVLDSTQPMVTSLPGSDGEFITALTPPGCDVLAMIAVDPTTLPVDPEGFTLPSGMLEFELDCASAVVELLFHGAPPLGGASYRKYGPEPTDPSLHWYDLAGAVFGSTMVGAAEVPTATLTLTDGGQGDSILTPDGRILDPGGPGFISGTPAVEIPTASEVGLIAIALLLAIAAVRRLRHT